ncbi:hypothetical protein JCM5350_000279 [Sporobolomyces pararoseus]
MSCGQPSSEEAQSENIPILPPPSTTCVRCGNPPKIVVRATAWCHDCFLNSFQGRFRKSLEGAKIVSKNGFKAYKTGGGGGNGNNNKKKELSKVVLAFSGGASSRAMLELFKTSYYKQQQQQQQPEEPNPVERTAAAEEAEGEEALEPKKKKKVSKPQQFPPAFSDCYVVFIDESELPGFGPDKTEEIREIVETTTPFKFLPIKLSSIFSTSTSTYTSTSLLSTSISSSSSLPSKPSISTTASSPLSQLLSLLHPQTTQPLPPTTYSSLHQTLLSTLLLKTAQSIKGCELLLLGENSTRIGIKTISGMSQGRGFSLGEEISIEYIHSFSRGGGGGDDDDDGDEGEELMVCRPMGNTLSKEVGYFTKSEGLKTVTVRNEDTSLVALEGTGVVREGPAKVEKDIKKIGIGKLVEDFVLNLEAQFPSTVSIITKTAHKLGMRSADYSSSTPMNQCALCEMPAQSNAESWNRSITISDLISARQALEQPALPTTLESINSTSSTTTGGVKKREPYQPSKNHLLPPSSSSSSSSTTTTTTETNDTDEQSLPTSTVVTNEKEETTNEEDSSFDLSNHLCYACLLLVQTSKPSKRSGGGGGGGNGEETLELPGYVLENVERRRRKTDVTQGGNEERSGLRQQIQEYLLD